MRAGASSVRICELAVVEARICEDGGRTAILVNLALLSTLSKCSSPGRGGGWYIDLCVRIWRGLLENFGCGFEFREELGNFVVDKRGRWIDL